MPATDRLRKRGGVSGSNETRREQAPPLYRHSRRKLQCAKLKISLRNAFRGPGVLRLASDQGRKIVGATGGTGGEGGVGDFGDIKPGGGDGTTA